MDSGTFLDVPGFRVGHHTDRQAATGCTVVLCDRPTVGGCLVAGGAPGTRETSLLDPTCLVEEVHAVLLGGGSAYGLEAAGGVMRYLEESGRGFDMRVARVPIVPAAILFDLTLGSASVRPGPEDGYRACLAASAEELPEGNVGAGTGATVGKALGPALAMKGGLGSASVRLSTGTVVGALVAVNCVGDVVDPASGEIVAGARRPDGAGFLDTSRWLRSGGAPSASPGANTTIGVIATDARLTKSQANRLARLAYQGMARAIRPITPFDGDTLFALGSAGAESREEDLSSLGEAAAEALARAIVRGVRGAEGLHGCPAERDLRSG
ncbi:MAG: P1 family peptidase [Sphingomonadaceae bacterium]